VLIFARFSSVFLAAVLCFAAVPSSAETIRVGGLGGAETVMRKISAAFMAANPGITVEVMNRLGGTGSIKAIIAGAIDVAITGRNLTDAEKASAPIIETDLARTPVLFTTNNRSVHSISREEAVAIYAGRKTTWPDNSNIRPIVRESTESDIMLLASLIPDYAPAIEKARMRPELPTAGNDIVNAERALSIQGSFTAITLLQMKADNLSLTPLKLDGVEATVENLAAGRYPVAKQIRVVARQDAGALIKLYLAFLRSDATRQILEQNGALARQQ
jgi:phosphate transport system substrate-binding protein